MTFCRSVNIHPGEFEMIKMTIILRRNPSMTHDEFVAYHKDDHASLFSQLPEAKQYVRRYVQCHPGNAALPGLPESNIDGITELWFDSMADLENLFSSPVYSETIRPDEEKFLDIHACEFLLGTENEVIPLV